MKQHQKLSTKTTRVTYIGKRRLIPNGAELLENMNENTQSFLEINP